MLVGLHVHAEDQMQLELVDERLLVFGQHVQAPVVVRRRETERALLVRGKLDERAFVLLLLHLLDEEDETLEDAGAQLLLVLAGDHFEQRVEQVVQSLVVIDTEGAMGGRRGFPRDERVEVDDKNRGEFRCRGQAFDVILLFAERLRFVLEQVEVVPLFGEQQVQPELVLLALPLLAEIEQTAGELAARAEARRKGRVRRIENDIGTTLGRERQVTTVVLVVM